MRRWLVLLLGLGWGLALAQFGGLAVQVSLDKATAAVPVPTYRIGENGQIFVRVAKDAYLYVFNVNSDESIDLVLPNALDKRNLARANQTFQIPPKGASWAITVGEPEGESAILVLATRRPIALEEIADVERGEVMVSGAQELGEALGVLILAAGLGEADYGLGGAEYVAARGPPAPQAATGKLVVESTPRGAQVFVNGKFAGTTPLTLSLAAGRAEVEVRLEGHQTYKVAVTVKAGETTRLAPTLARLERPGTLAVRSSPSGAQVLLDGKAVGTTPLTLQLKPGKYSLEVRRDGYRLYKTTVTVQAGQTAQVTAALQAAAPQPATLVVQSPTPGATATVNGQAYGAIPPGGLKVSLNTPSATVVVSAPGYQTKTQTVALQPGKTSTVSLALQAAASGPAPVAQAPVVRVVAPAPRSEVEGLEFSLSLRILNPSGAPLDIEVLDAGGQPLTKLEARNIAPQAASTVNVTVRLPPGTPEGVVFLTVIVTPKGGAPSEPQPLQVTYKPRAQPQAVARRLRVLAVGIDRYSDPVIRPLRYSAKDAADFTRLFQSQKGRLYDEVEVQLFTNEKARLEDVKFALDTFRKTSSKNDTTILFFSGHGFNDGPDYYIPMHDSKYDRLSATALPQRDLEFFMRGVQGRIMVFIDTCYSGGAIGVRDVKSSSPNSLVQGLNASALGDRMIMAASSGSEFALEDERWGNGAFTLALVEALSGKAADAVDSRGEVTPARLFDYVVRRVQQLTDGKQTPQQQFSGTSFALVRVR
ncbi:PEGA domain-containing protein [Calidithermus chliarophilus]|uniref:PEGA domain-containing protein n=1 Tax=Calidithermus chliarophilus TaxID=52023 RepID=UPI0003F94B3B|nr:PEGA domain-containing protein [Calidithermus chliarophilus]